jgi:CheY-like chemotaxis protein
MKKYTRNTLAFVLENAGYQVVEVANGQDALHQLLHLTHAAHPIDLMILDIEMAGLTGWHVLDELKRSQVAIPTIVITGLIDEQLLQKIQDDRGLEYLRKPKEGTALKIFKRERYHVCAETSFIVQDGHGMLPMFSYFLKDALMLKIFNLVFGILIGLPLLLLGW